MGSRASPASSKRQAGKGDGPELQDKVLEVPQSPSQWLPGSVQKKEEMKRRVEGGQQPCHPDDERGESEQLVVFPGGSELTSGQVCDRLGLLDDDESAAADLLAYIRPLFNKLSPRQPASEETPPGAILPIARVQTKEPAAEWLAMESFESPSDIQSSTPPPVPAPPTPPDVEQMGPPESPPITQTMRPDGLVPRDALEQPGSHASPRKPPPNLIVLPGKPGVARVVFRQSPGDLLTPQSLLQSWRQGTKLSKNDVSELLEIFVDSGVFIREGGWLRKTTAQVQVAEVRRLAVTGSGIQRELPQPRGNPDLTVDEIIDRLHNNPDLLDPSSTIPETLESGDKDEALRLVGLVLCSYNIEVSAQPHTRGAVTRSILNYTGYSPGLLKKVVLHRSYSMLLEKLERSVERLALEDVCKRHNLDPAEHSMTQDANALLLRIATHPSPLSVEDVRQMQDLWGLEREHISKFVRTVLCKAKDEMFRLLAGDKLLTLMLNAKRPGIVETVRGFAYGSVHRTRADEVRQMNRVRKITEVDALFKAVIFAREEPSKKSTPRLEVPPPDKLKKGWSEAFKQEYLKDPQKTFAEAQKLSLEKIALPEEDTQPYLRRIFLVALAGRFGTRPEDQRNYPAPLTQEFKLPRSALHGIVRQSVEAILKPVVEQYRGRSFAPEELSKALLELLPKELCAVWWPAKGLEVLKLRLSGEGNFRNLGAQIGLTESQFSKIWDEWKSISAIKEAQNLLHIARSTRIS